MSDIPVDQQTESAARDELDRLAAERREPPATGAPQAADDPMTFRRLPDYPEPPGVAGAFCGVAGGALIVVVALFYHNLRRPAPWPKYWL
jgi:hypothetical protein